MKYHLLLYYIIYYIMKIVNSHTAAIPLQNLCNVATVLLQLCAVRVKI